MDVRTDGYRSPAAAVRQAIATLERCRPDQLGDLDSVVDVDELNAIVDPPSGEGGDDDGRSFLFAYCGYAVAVHSDGTIQVEP